jgi:hypothetical protein
MVDVVPSSLCDEGTDSSTRSPLLPVSWRLRGWTIHPSHREKEQHTVVQSRPSIEQRATHRSERDGWAGGESQSRTRSSGRKKRAGLVQVPETQRPLAVKTSPWSTLGWRSRLGPLRRRTVSERYWRPCPSSRREVSAVPVGGRARAQVRPCEMRVCQAVIASRTLAVSTNCSKRTMRPPRTTKWWATRTLMFLPVSLLVAV